MFMFAILDLVSCYYLEQISLRLWNLQDFERLDNNDATFCENCPVVLVTWGGIRIKTDYDPFEDSIIVLNTKEFLENLEKLIELY